MTEQTDVFTIRHRKALIEVLSSLSHHQIDQLLAEHPVSGDPGNGAAKAARVELIVRTLLEVQGQNGLNQGLTMIDEDALTEQQAKAHQMLLRRCRRMGHPIVVQQEPEAGREPALTPPAAESPADGGGTGNQQLVAVGGTEAMRAQLAQLEGLEVVLVEDQGTRAQAMAVLSAVATALQTPGAVVAVGGPTEMLTRLSLKG